jgi:hypothetical protein
MKQGHTAIGVPRIRDVDGNDDCIVLNAQEQRMRHTHWNFLAVPGQPYAIDFEQLQNFDHCDNGKSDSRRPGPVSRPSVPERFGYMSIGRMELFHSFEKDVATLATQLSLPKGPNAGSRAASQSIFYMPSRQRSINVRAKAGAGSCKRSSKYCLHIYITLAASEESRKQAANYLPLREKIH